jgi:hypothetical protein
MVFSLHEYYSRTQLLLHWNIPEYVCFHPVDRSVNNNNGRPWSRVIIAYPILQGICFLSEDISLNNEVFFTYKSKKLQLRKRFRLFFLVYILFLYQTYIKRSEARVYRQDLYHCWPEERWILPEAEDFYWKKVKDTLFLSQNLEWSQQDEINHQRCTVVLHSFNWKNISKTGLYFFLKKAKLFHKKRKRW